MTKAKQPASQRLARIALILLLVVAAGLRLMGGNLTVGATQVFADPDSYTHLRYVHHLLATGHPLEYDYYLGFPAGTWNVYPPLMHYLTAIPALLASGDSHLAANAVANAIPVLAGVLSVFASYIYACRLSGPGAGLFAALLVTLTAEHIHRTRIGNFDNNAVEPLLLMGFVLATAGCLARGPAHGARTAFGLRAAVLGITSWVCLFTWRGAILFWLCLMLYAWIEVSLAGWRRRDLRASLRPLGQAALVFAALVLPFVLLERWSARNTGSFIHISWPHVLLPLCTAGLCLLPTALAEPVSQRRLGRLAAVLSALLLLATGAWLLHPKLFGEAFAFLHWAYIDHISGLGVTELRSLFFDEGQLDFATIDYLGLLPFLGLPLWLWHFLRARAAGFPSPSLFLLAWTGTLLVATASSMRFAALGVMAAACLAAGAWQSIGHYLSQRWGTAAAAAGAAILAAITLAPTWPVIEELVAPRQPSADDQALVEILTWLREETPPPGDPTRPDGRPDYGVLSDWGHGTAIATLGQRPAVASSLFEAGGLIPAARFFLAPTFADLDAIAADSRVRYVVISPIMPVGFARLLGLAPESYVSMERDRLGRPDYQQTDAWLQLAASRLLMVDGAPYTPAPSQDYDASFRLVYESAARLPAADLPWPVPRLKVFERVPGARIFGRTAPDAVVEATLPLISRHGRRSAWAAVIRADHDGSFILHVPYATGSMNGTVKTSNYYLIKLPDRNLNIEIDESAIMTGAGIKLPD